MSITLKNKTMKYKFVPLQGQPLVFTSALNAYSFIMHKNYEVKVIHQNLLLFLEKEKKDPLLKDYKV